jgi:DNA polymerase (family 10)
VPVHNADIADALNRLGELLEIEGASVFRVRAYRNAARLVASLPHSVESMLARGEDLSELPGIGNDLAGKIQEFVQTGHVGLLDEVEARTPGELASLAELPGLGPKRVKLLYEQLGIHSLEDAARAASAQKIRTLKGFGKKTEERLLHEIERRRGAKQRIKLFVAEEYGVPLLEYLRGATGVKQATIAGSYRRRLATVGDLDILVTGRGRSTVMDRLVGYEDVEEVISKGETRSTVRLRSGLQVDVRVVAPHSYGAALHYFTGSKTHNIAVRKRGVDRGLKINEYGVFKGDRRVGGRTEEEVYDEVDLPYIEPELREGRGEIEAAEAGALPSLVRLDDMRGDLQCHTKASDGRATLRQMAEAAQKKGYHYLAVTDHSQRVTVAHGLDAKRLGEQLEAIDRLNDEFEGFRLLKAVEVDILEDGSLDLPNAILQELDLTVCSVHYKLDLRRDKQTRRVLRAMDNPYFNILAHPTGRLIGEREPAEMDMEAVMEGARERGCFLEINAQPDRLDLDDVHCRMAKEMGLKLAISTDAHAMTDLDFMRFGVDQARRGWLEADDVLNTRTWRQLRRLLQRS